MSSVHHSKMQTYWQMKNFSSILYIRVDMIEFKGQNVSFWKKKCENVSNFLLFFHGYSKVRDEDGQPSPVHVYVRSFIYYLQNLDTHVFKILRIIYHFFRTFSYQTSVLQPFSGRETSKTLRIIWRTINVQNGTKLKHFFCEPGVNNWRNSGWKTLF